MCVYLCAEFVHVSTDALTERRRASWSWSYSHVGAACMGAEKQTRVPSKSGVHSYLLSRLCSPGLASENAGFLSASCLPKPQFLVSCLSHFPRRC